MKDTKVETKKINKEVLKNDILSIIMIIVGTFIMGIGFNFFITPNGISSGGFSGLAEVIGFFLAKINIKINTSIIYLVLNIGLYIFAYKLNGKKFAMFSLVGIVAFSLAMEVTNMFNFYFEEDLLVCSLYGGALFGLGSGIVIKYNGSTGGCDMLASIIRTKSPKLKTGQIILICDAFVLILSVLAYGANSLLYSLITVFLAGQLTDIVIDGSREIKAYYIITDKKEEVSKAIFDNIKRGATEIKSQGMYSHKEKSVILCLINKYRAPMLKKLVLDIDNSAFIFSTKVSDVLGNGFYVPPQKPNKKKGKKSKETETDENSIEIKTQILNDTKIEENVENNEKENKADKNLKTDENK